MDNFMDQINSFTDLSQVVQIQQVLLCLLLTFVLSTIVAKVYQYTYSGPAYSPAFMQTLVICGMVVGAVMLVIGSNIARAFSLVGALSIIRFRNAVKDPRDVGFIFLVMALGMATGTGFYQVAILLTAVICLAILVLHFTGFGGSTSGDRVIRIRAPQVEGFEKLFGPVLAQHTTTHSLLSVENSKFGTELELTYAVKVKKNFSPETLISSLRKLNDSLVVQVLGSNHTLDL